MSAQTTSTTSKETTKKYVPPHLRRKQEENNDDGDAWRRPGVRSLGSGGPPERMGSSSQHKIYRPKHVSDVHTTTKRNSQQDVRTTRRGRENEDHSYVDVSREAEEGRVVSAYEAQREASGFGLLETEAQDAKVQYAKLVEFSRYRREQLGQTRAATSGAGSGKHRRQSAPRAFGTNDHGRGLEADEDLPGARRVDEAGMVYAFERKEEEETRAVRRPGGGEGETKHPERSSNTTRGAYFCDRFRRYKFYCGSGGLGLLRALVQVNDVLLATNASRLSNDPAVAARERAEGYALYEEKPNLRRVGSEIGTWTDREYGLAGFQFFYLRLKSFQRFCESWALFERVDAAGLLFPSFNDDDAATDTPLTVCSLGGGPGYELLAFDWYARFHRDRRTGEPSSSPRRRRHSDEAYLSRWDDAASRPAPVTGLALASFDLQPSWEAYTERLGYDFKRWDVHAADAADAVLALRPPVVCLLSNILCYCTDEPTADLFAKLLKSGRVTAIIANERGAVQGMIPMLERRGLRAIRLLDQANAGRDDRQVVFLPPAASETETGTRCTTRDDHQDASSSRTHSVYPNIPLPDDFWRVFPNQPYEEKKGVPRVV